MYKNTIKNGGNMTILTSRVISIYDRKTTMRLAKAEWTVLDNICYLEKIKRKNLLELIDQNRDKKIGLTPSVRLFNLLYLYEMSAQFATQNAFLPNHENLQKTLEVLHL